MISPHEIPLIISRFSDEVDIFLAEPSCWILQDEDDYDYDSCCGPEGGKEWVAR